MKQKDIAMIVVVAFVSGVASIFLSKALISPAKNRKQTAEVVQAIKADFGQPDPKYFNQDSIDPTQLITIGNNNNPQPFNASN